MTDILPQLADQFAGLIQALVHCVRQGHIMFILAGVFLNWALYPQTDAG